MTGQRAGSPAMRIAIRLPRVKFRLERGAAVGMALL
jgi:hypothetical protein